MASFAQTKIPSPARAAQSYAQLAPARADVPASAIAALERPGVPLAGGERQHAPSDRGHRFADVRILHDEAAARAADDLNADAFTFGTKIAFARGRYQPGTAATARLLAHELRHVRQQPAMLERPIGVAASDTPAEREARAGSPGAAALAPPGLIHRQERIAPAPTSAPRPAPRPGTAVDETSPPHAQPGGEQRQTPEQRPTRERREDPQQAQGDLRTRVRAWLDLEEFHLPLVMDTDRRLPEEWHAIYSDQRMTLAQIRDDTWEVLNQTMPGIKRGDVWQHVYQYFQEKMHNLEAATWQLVIQPLYTPSRTLWSSPAVPSGQSPWQNSLQLSVGLTRQSHPQGYGGLEQQVSVAGSFFNLGSGHTDWFQNLLAQYQVSDVTPVGSDFRIGSAWASAQASIYAQLAAGMGSNWDTTATGDRRVNLGLLIQPGLGAQMQVTIGWFQIVAQGTVVYSYFHPTTHVSGISAQDVHNVGVQGGLGAGFQIQLPF